MVKSFWKSYSEELPPIGIYVPMRLAGEEWHGGVHCRTGRYTSMDREDGHKFEWFDIKAAEDSLKERA